MEFKVNPREFLKKKRREVDLTLREIAELTGFSKGYISRIENGSSTPSLEAIFKLASALDFDVEDICWMEEEKKQSEKMMKIFEESLEKPVPLYEMTIDMGGDVSEMEVEWFNRVQVEFRRSYTGTIKFLLELHSTYIIELIRLSVNATYPLGIKMNEKKKLLFSSLTALIDKEAKEVHCDCRLFFYTEDKRATRSIHEKLSALHILIADQIEKEEF